MFISFHVSPLYSMLCSYICPALHLFLDSSFWYSIFTGHHLCFLINYSWSRLEDVDSTNDVIPTFVVWDRRRKPSTSSALDGDLPLHHTPCTQSFFCIQSLCVCLCCAFCDLAMYLCFLFACFHHFSMTLHQNSKNFSVPISSSYLLFLYTYIHDYLYHTFPLS